MKWRIAWEGPEGTLKATFIDKDVGDFLRMFIDDELVDTDDQITIQRINKRTILLAVNGDTVVRMEKLP